MGDLHRSDYSRVFLLEGRASPARAPLYQGLWKPGAVSWDQGDVTTTRLPDPNRYGQFTRVAKIIGEPGDPELPIMAKHEFDLSKLLKLARNGCDHDIRVHMGDCQNPQDQARGWNKILVLEAGHITTYSTEDLGALSPDERTHLNEEVTFVGEDLYEVVRVNFSRMAGDYVGREVKSIYVCDSVQCGVCGVSSDGCQVVLAAVDPSEGSPGLLAEIVSTQNGGASWVETVISSLGAAETVAALLCIGSNVVVFSADSDSLHYAETADVVKGDGSETWAEVDTGFVATKGPLAASSLGPSQTWIAAEGGYIYYTEDPASGVEVQDSGSNTVQDLLAIHAYDANNVVAVGASNAVLRTQNGGITWSAVTGPAVGIDLNTVWMRTATEWLVGTAGGRLFYTTDGGETWTEKTFPGSGSGSVRDIKFVTPIVGYMAHSTSAPAGRILRSIDGGSSWYVLPEGTGSIPANDYIGTLAVCDDPNVVYGGGLADDELDGIIVKGA